MMMTAPTPMMMPSMVSVARSLFARRASIAVPMLWPIAIEPDTEEGNGPSTGTSSGSTTGGLDGGTPSTAALVWSSSTTLTSGSPRACQVIGGWLIDTLQESFLARKINLRLTVDHAEVK